MTDWTIRRMRWKIDALNAMRRPLVYNRDLPPIGVYRSDLAYGSHRQQRADLAVPMGSGPFPMMLFIHGGGWISGEKSSFRRLCHWFAHRGFLVANINYRLAPDYPFPAAVSDVAAAVDWLVSVAPSVGGDAKRLFLAGDSAGAHLAAWYACARHHQRPGAILENVTTPAAVIRGLLLWYGVFDLTRNVEPIAAMVRAFLGSDPDGGRADLASVLPHLSAAMPPMWVCCGEVDPLYAQTKALLKAIKRLKLRHDALIFDAAADPRAEHAFITDPANPCTPVALDSALDFMGRI